MPYSPSFKASGPLTKTPQGVKSYQQAVTKDAKQAALMLGATVALIPATAGASALFLPFAALHCFQSVVSVLTAEDSLTVKPKPL